MLTVRPNFSSGTIANNGQTICYGATPGNIGSSAAASGGDGNISYQWYNGSSSITGATATTYTPAAYKSNVGAHTFTRRAKDGACSASLTAAAGSWVLTVRPNFTPGAIPTTGQTVCHGGALNAIGAGTAASGGNNVITYEWRHNGTAISGATVSSYTPASSYNTQPGGHTFTRWAKDGACSITPVQSTGQWVLTVHALPAISFASPPANLWTNSETVLTVNDSKNVASSYCFTYECSACVYNPYLTGNDAPAAAACHWYSECVYGTANTFTVHAYDAGTITIKAKAKSAAGCEGSANNITIAVGASSNTPVGSTWTFTDTRDSKTYKIVKMPDNRVWFAQNLNYTADLTFNPYSNKANGAEFTDVTNGVPAIGSYWCPTTTGSTTVTEQSACNRHGALYTWETAMMVDGKYADESKSSTAWAESWVSPYYISAAVAAGSLTVNSARGGRGICPKGWHVPTEAELAVLFDAVDGSTISNGVVTAGTGTAFRTQASDSWAGTNAGTLLKSSSTCTDCGTGNEPCWVPGTAANGSDLYGFCLTPSSLRSYTGSDIGACGDNVWWWSSSVVGIESAYNRWWSNTSNEGIKGNGIARNSNPRSYAWSVRCVYQ